MSQTPGSAFIKTCGTGLPSGLVFICRFRHCRFVTSSCSKFRCRPRCCCGGVGVRMIKRYEEKERDRRQQMDDYYYKEEEEDDDDG